MAAPAWERHFHECAHKCVGRPGHREGARQTLGLSIPRWKSYLELAQIRFFLILCRTLSFKRAAERCDVALSQLTRAIEKLEAELGGPLVGHLGGNIYLTALGLEMQPHLKIMLQAAEDAAPPGKPDFSIGAYRLSIGLAPRISAAKVAGAAREVARMFPGLSLNLDQTDSPELVSQLLAGQHDCALLDESRDIPDCISRWTLFTDHNVSPRSSECPAVRCVVLAAVTHRPLNIAVRHFLRLCRSMDMARFIGDD